MIASFDGLPLFLNLAYVNKMGLGLGLLYTFFHHDSGKPNNTYNKLVMMKSEDASKVVMDGATIIQIVR